MGFLRRFVNVFRQRRIDRDFDDELEFHRQMCERQERQRGLSAADAEQSAKRRLGNRSIAKEEMRDARVIQWLASSLQDLRHGVVLLRRDPGVSGLIILVLALGIGGTAAIFTLLKAAFIDPLPYRDAGRLVTILEVTGWNPNTSGFLAIRQRSHLLEQLAFAEHRDMQITGTGEPRRVFAARVTASFFPLLGVEASQGRTFLDEDNQPGKTASVVLTDTFWRNQMGSDPHAVGSAMRLDGASAIVVGILPSGFHFDYPTLGIPEPVDIYVSYPVDSSVPLNASSNGLGVAVRVLARLQDGVTLAEADAELRNIARVLTHEHPESFPNPQNDPSLFHFTILPLRDATIGSQRSLLWLLLGGVTVLLLIACVNTAQLLLARSLRRGREIAVRSALGASRFRLIRQFLFEGIVLAGCGGIAGLLAASWIARTIVSLLPLRSPLLASAHLDLRVVAFTLAISMISAIVFAIIPALKGSRWTPGPNLNARAATEGNRWRHIMIAIEAALSVFLLCGAGLVAQNLWTLISAPSGFDPNHVVVMRLQLPSRKPNLPDPTAGLMFQEYLERVQAVPGVDSAATVTGPPLRPSRAGPQQIVGEIGADGKPKTIVAWGHQISADYFRTLRIPLLAGRTFRRGDAGKKISIAIVNAEFARQFGLGANVVGRQLNDPDGPITIVGMVGNVRTSGVRVDPFPEVYFSNLEFSWPNAYLVARSAVQSASLVKAIQGAIRSANADQSVFGIMTMDDLLANSAAEPRFNVYLIGAFSLLALVMAATGTYSVISCLVSQRTGEIAVRLALGASRRAIVRTVLGTTAGWVTGGLLSGLSLALATKNTIRSLSSTAATGSPWMYLSMMMFFFVVTLMAAYVPMHGASRIDPAEALRCD